MSWIALSKEEMARRVADDIFHSAYVNLGIGMPTLVANYLDPQRNIMLHSENGVLGMGPTPVFGSEDADLINAGKQPITIIPGAAFFHHGDSFAMMRGGHIDVCVLGAFQVAMNGDLANWSTGDEDAIPAVGGAMDLAVGARNVWVMMSHTTRDGKPKIVRNCDYPLTGLSCVNRVYTDLCVLDVKDDGFWLRDIVQGLELDELQSLTDAPLNINI